MHSEDVISHQDEHSILACRMRRWLLLPACDAHVSWLPGEVRPDSERKLRMASLHLRLPSVAIPRCNSVQWRLMIWLMKEEIALFSSLQKMTGVLFRDRMRRVIDKRERQRIQDVLGDSIFLDIGKMAGTNLSLAPSHVQPVWDDPNLALRLAFLAVHHALSMHTNFLAERMLLRFPRDPWSTWAKTSDDSIVLRSYASLALMAMQGFHGDRYVDS